MGELLFHSVGIFRNLFASRERAQEVNLEAKRQCHPIPEGVRLPLPWVVTIPLSEGVGEVCSAPTGNTSACGT